MAAREREKEGGEGGREIGRQGEGETKTKMSFIKL